MRRPDLGRALLVAALVATAVLAGPADGAAPATACDDATVAAATVAEAAMRAAIRCLVNDERAEHALPRLRPSAELNVAADRHCADMVARHYFEHRSPEGASVADRAREAGYLGRARDWELGEDIGWGTGSLSTPAAIVRAWMNSPPHRRIILDHGFRDVGVGVAAGVPIPGLGGGATFVLDLGDVG
jgi:uncharacterized protein YkwD